ncbi:MAG TPA: lactonase family protein [Candidatus Acidoferrales bacterium]
MRMRGRIFGWGMSVLLVLFIFGGFAPAARAQRYYVYIGTYTEHGSEGIYVCDFDAATGKLGAPMLAAKSVQPSFLAVSPDRKFMYAVNEADTFNGQPGGGVSAYAIDFTTGRLNLLNAVSSRGGGPAFIALDKTGHFALVANYDGGSVAVFRLGADGKIGESTGFAQHAGSSVNHERQEAPHAHAVAMSPDNRFAIVADLGLDQLLVYPFDATNGTLGSARVVKTAPSAGPRHLVFSASGNFLYVVNELASTVTAYSWDAARGEMTPVQTISTGPAGPQNTAGEVLFDPAGKFLYVSNRGGENSIAVFRVDVGKGTLRRIESVPTNGQTPRNFAFDPLGRWLLVGNQDSKTVYTFKVAKHSGRLKQAGPPVAIDSPAMVDFVTLPTTFGPIIDEGLHKKN